MRRLLICLVPLILTGCATVSPQKLGISKQQWESYSQAQQDAILKGYAQAKNNRMRSGSDQTDATLTVAIRNGKMLMPPFTQLASYQPVEFDISAGQCNRKITVASSEDPKQKTRLIVCFRDNVLYLDPSPYDPAKADGSLKMPYMPTWQRGFTYPKVSSTGYAKLTDVDISVQSQQD
ncbi:MAG: hypothetical protein QM752_05000 [Gammaproteobacteria bacterium]